jgi:hypothetical protein
MFDWPAMRYTFSGLAVRAGAASRMASVAMMVAFLIVKKAIATD